MADGSDLRAYSKNEDTKAREVSERAFGDNKMHRRKKGNGKRAPKIAFTGEEYGFGYQALGMFTKEASRRARNGRAGVYDGGAKAAKKIKLDQDAQHLAQFDDFDFQKENQRLPLRTKEQALMAVKSGTADYAIVPFYSPYFGYDFETLRALNTLTGMMAVEQYEADDNMCLAVHESQVLELAQSAHPGSGLSSVLKHERKNWGSHERVRGEKNLDINGQSEFYRAGLAIDHSAQLMLRDRLDMVFAGPEAARRCKSKLDGLRSIGVELAETPQTVEPHRELARRALASLSGGRQVNTFFDPKSGDAHYVSSISGESHSKTQLYGVVLPFNVAMMSSDYVIVDPDMDDSESEKTRFFVVHKNPDHSLFEDAYRTTDAKTRYWERRLKSIARRAQDDSYALGDEKGKIKGVRVMLRFLRDKNAASTGDIENYLRNFGVPFNIVRIDEDSGADGPAPIIVDVEFSFAHGDFGYYPFTRRFRGAVVNGFLKKSFARWKNRGVLVLAAVPFEEPQMPRHKARRWWKEAFVARQRDFVETMFIRFSRVLFIYVLPLAVVAGLLFFIATKLGLL